MGSAPCLRVTLFLAVVSQAGHVELQGLQLLREGRPAAAFRHALRLTSEGRIASVVHEHKLLAFLVSFPK